MATNERLRRAMLRNGLDVAGLAEKVDVNAKSVERWMTGKTIPYPTTRFRIATVLNEDEGYLWPEAAGDPTALAQAEIVAIYPRRALVPRNLWVDLLRGAERQVDILVYAGVFLCEEYPEWLDLLRARLKADVLVRLLLGDPEGIQLAARDQERSIGGGVAGRVAAVLGHYAPLLGTPGMEVRLHNAPLYNSIYRFDDQMLVNVHAYGLLAFQTPSIHLRRVDGAYFDTYAESFERCWMSARPLPPGGLRRSAP